MYVPNSKYELNNHVCLITRGYGNIIMFMVVVYTLVGGLVPASNLLVCL